ncbi:DUF695 domain-containing protein [Sinosporangium siamense]|uniref:DUF695 domain-containing protein n=1 Tax=Sinosporangium siamense TaxID=1367973 RepID=A0A919RGY7_9ACTN|nr:DUF695 domain-containing protein [Sinosporangium siamense]GII92600.1 hypothetical protein Ssi02_28310 [Sinosporangium siamense]
MRPFARKSASAEADQEIKRFWTWWEKARPELSALAADDDNDKMGELLTAAVNAIHPGLAWEVTSGLLARHALTVTAAGDPELRSTAHRWARAAPEDADWEFYPSRQPVLGASELTLDAGGVEVPLDQMTLGLRVPPGRPRLDVAAYHPVFDDLDEEARMEATLLALDSLLGEDEVARWIGEITPATFPPIDAVAAAFLPAVVNDLASGYEDEQWTLLEGQADGGVKIVALARMPLRQVDHPLFDQHISITLPYRHATAEGLPAETSLSALNDFEERLTAQVAQLGGDALIVAHMSMAGRRLIHIYADPAASVQNTLKKTAATWKEGRAAIEVNDDPGWIAIAPFLS